MAPSCLLCIQNHTCQTFMLLTKYNFFGIKSFGSHILPRKFPGRTFNTQLEIPTKQKFCLVGICLFTDFILFSYHRDFKKDYDLLIILLLRKKPSLLFCCFHKIDAAVEILEDTDIRDAGSDIALGKRLTRFHEEISVERGILCFPL